MRALIKSAHSIVISQKLGYRKNADNSRLTRALLKDQSRFCAYSEKLIGAYDEKGAETEHFNPFLKYQDNHTNWYAVTRAANLRKRKKENQPDFKQMAQAKAFFFGSLFFQADTLFQRVHYIPGEFTYEPQDDQDSEAWLLLDYLGINDSVLVTERRNYIRRLKSDYKSKWTLMERFKNHPTDICFITAIAGEFKLSQSQLDELLTCINQTFDSGGTIE